MIRQSNLIELTPKFCQSNTIERSEIEHFNNLVIVPRNNRTLGQFHLDLTDQGGCVQTSYVLASISSRVRKNVTDRAEEPIT